MPRSPTAPVPPRTRVFALVGLAFRSLAGRRRQPKLWRLFAAQSRSLQTPCQRLVYASRLPPMTRGQVGSLLLSLFDISVDTSHRSPGAPGGDAGAPLATKSP